MWKRRNILRSPEGDGAATGAGGAGAAAGAGDAGTAGAGAGQGGDANASGAAGAGDGKGTTGASGAEGSTAGDGKGASDASKGYWPADWREKYSSTDAKKLERLQRYASPEAAMDALFAAQNKISSGELKPVLGKDAKPEDVTSYRKAHGIPESHDKYDLGADLKIEEREAPLIGEFLKAAHATNQTPDQVKASIKTWKAIETKALEYRAEADADLAKSCEDALRAEWGAEYRRTNTVIQNMLDLSGSQELKEKLLHGRLSDGTPIGSSPEAMKFFAALALIHNPTSTVVPGFEANPVAGIDNRIAEIEKMMRTDRKAYNDPKISGPGGEYSRLLEAKEKMKPKAA